MNLVLLDDEPLANARLKRLLMLQGFAAEQIQCFEAFEPAWQFMSTHPVMLLLLDIDMPVLSGMEVAKRIRQQSWGQQMPIIFITAHPEHALSAFRVRAMDYLLKPVVAHEFAQTLSQLFHHRWLLVQQAGVQWRLPWQQILYLQAQDKLTRVQYQQREFWLPESLKQMEDQLPSGWLRVHRAYLVNMMWVDALITADNEHHLLLGEQIKIPVSRRLLAAVREYWELFKQKNARPFPDAES